MTLNKNHFNNLSSNTRELADVDDFMILTNSRETGFSRTLKMYLSPVRRVTNCFSPSLQLVVVFCGQGRKEQCKQYPRSLREATG